MKTALSRTFIALTCALVATGTATLIAQAGPRADAEVVDRSSQTDSRVDVDTGEVDSRDEGALCTGADVHRADADVWRPANRAGCIPSNHACRVSDDQCCTACVPLGVGGLGRCA